MKFPCTALTQAPPLHQPTGGDALLLQEMRWDGVPKRRGKFGNVLGRFEFKIFERAAGALGILGLGGQAALEHFFQSHLGALRGVVVELKERAQHYPWAAFDFAFAVAHLQRLLGDALHSPLLRI